MAATHAAFEHFVQTGEFNVSILPPEQDKQERPYFTYEIGIDERVHPDPIIARRFVEVAMSDCEFGCKIYADPYSSVRVLVHYAVYGCRKTAEVLEQEID